MTNAISTFQVLSFMILMVQRLGRDSNTQLLGDWNLDRDLFT